MEDSGAVPKNSSSMSELDLLVDEARDGNDSAFEKLWRHFQPKLLRYLSMFTKDAEDLCSEVWIRIAGAIKDFDGDSSAFQGWIFTIARNAATDHSRKEKRKGTHVEISESDWV
jgi:RNA polymerase sigma-70 factor (ECF subfamily)